MPKPKNARPTRAQLEADNRALRERVAALEAQMLKLVEVARTPASTVFLPPVVAPQPFIPAPAPVPFIQPGLTWPPTYPEITCVDAVARPALAGGITHVGTVSAISPGIH